MKMAADFVDLAIWRAVMDSWNTPNAALAHDYATLRTPGMI